MEIRRRTIKCEICYGDLLGDISDIKDSDERFDKLHQFCELLQEICHRESKIDTLSNWRKFKF